MSSAEDEFKDAVKRVGDDPQPSEAYWRAYEEWKRLPRDLGVHIDASKRFTRDEVHERR